ERAMRLADHGYKMARRGVASRGKRVDRIERRYQQAILDQQKLVAKLRQAEADIRFVRVKLAKAQQQDRKRERQAAASRTPQAVGTAQVQSKSAAPAPKPEPKAELSKAAEAEAVNAKPAAERLSAYDRVAQREAMELQAEIDQDIINKSSRRPLYKRLTLKGRFVNAAQFKFIGADHYRAEAKIKAGAQQFEVARNRFSREIPAADDGETYIFFYQAKSASRGVLKLFKKSLLSPRAQSIGRE
ncbi:MAG: hypothetical protein OIF38_06925, partial [Cellvibrionaceae bacterium]|nr:hypothetical protein [Cellvibrionaceae bacterium]